MSKKSIILNLYGFTAIHLYKLIKHLLILMYFTNLRLNSRAETLNRNKISKQKMRDKNQLAIHLKISISN